MVNLRLLKASKRRKLSLDEIEKVLRELPIKYYAKAVKTAKTFQVLKLTRKLQSLRDEEEKLEELHTVQKKLESLKKVDQISVGYHLARSAYPQITFDNPSKDTADQIPVDEILDLITSNKKYQEVLEELNNNLEPLFQSKETQLLKQKNRELNSQKKAPSGPKQSAVKAIFVESLAGIEETQLASDDDEDDNEDSEKRNEIKLQKQLRNNVNRQRNRQQREKQDLSAYMPIEERNAKNTKVSAAVDPKLKPNMKRSRNEFSHANDGDRSNKKLNTNNGRSAAVATTRKSATIETSDNQDMKQLALNGKEWKESGVHPSWAAKQAQKPMQIATGQGKKITFDD